VLVWAAAYVALVIVATAVVLSRRDPTVVRGDRVFLLTALFVLAAVTVTAFRGERFSLGVLVGAALLLVAGWLVQSRWWVIGSQSAAVAATIEECAARLCAPAALLPGACTITVPGGAVRLRIVPASSNSTMIVFVASARHRKASLFRRLLAKQYRAVVPTIRLGVLGGSGSG
jgi:hypothetical protein